MFRLKTEQITIAQKKMYDVKIRVLIPTLYGESEHCLLSGGLKAMPVANNPVATLCVF